MEIDYTISKKELVDFHMNHFDKTKNFKKLITFFYFYFSFSFFLIFLVTKNLLIIIIFAFFFLLRKKFCSFCLRKIFTKRFDLERYTSCFYPIKLSFNGKYLNLVTDLDEMHYRWISVQAIYLIDNYIFIKTFSTKDILIPCRAFKTSEDKKIFLDNIINATNLELKNSYPIGYCI